MAPFKRKITFKDGRLNIKVTDVNVNCCKWGFIGGNTRLKGMEERLSKRFAGEKCAIGVILEFDVRLSKGAMRSIDVKSSSFNEP